MQIGSDHMRLLKAMRGVLADLEQVASGEFASAFAQQGTRLDEWAARIAAIGQVKAGKSSTLNALVGRIGLLPADVNPWTSVITNMRFGIPGDPKSGARFEFFDEGSWDRIIAGDPAVRDVALKYLPGFDPELLRKQTEEMRHLAERRLGPSYVKLLGKHHDYDLLSGELLESYVCAGAGPKHLKEDDPVGRYAAITRIANLFMQSRKFAGPTIITDTPGVNDPFLVRDEFTCQSLDRSEIFLVMLSAHQALTEVDVALIRMLAQHEHKEMILYINRVDELENAAERVTRVVADVTERIRDAIPGGAVKIVTGSAWWAEAALDDDLSDSELRKIIRVDGIDAFNARNRQGTPTTPREKLMTASGLPEIESALADAIEQGSGAKLLQSVATETKARIAALKSVTRRRRNDLQDQIESFSAGNGSEYRKDLEQEMAILTETFSALAAQMEQTDSRIDRAVNQGWVAIQQQLDAETADFVARQRGAIPKLLQADPETERAQVDLLPLRVAMEERLRVTYSETRMVLDAILDEALAQAIAIAMRVLQGLEGQITMQNLPGETVAVTFSTSRKVLPFAMVSRRGLMFWKKTVNVKKSVEAFRRVTSAEVVPATNRMVTAFTGTLSERAIAGKARLDLVVQIVEDSLADRVQRLREDHGFLRDEEAGEATSKVLNRLRNDIELIDNRLRTLETKETLLGGADAEQAA